MVDAVFTFDTTGSMSPCIREVRRKLDTAVGQLFSQLPDLQIGFIAHGDYCDGARCVDVQDLTNNLDTLKTFIDKTPNTGGGDADECYEYVLNIARNKINWRVGSDRILVVIGDAKNHSHSQSAQQIKSYRVPGADPNGYHLDNEIQGLIDEGIKGYTVHCLNGYGKPMYEKIAANANGVMVPLSQFSDINDLLLAISYHNQGADSLESFAESLKNQNKMSRSLLNAFNALSSGTVGEKLKLTFTDYSKVDDKELTPVSPERFQMLEVDKAIAIKDFVIASGARFKTGKGFYELQKREEIQEYKEVVLQEKASGDMWAGAKARQMIGLPLGERGNIGPRNLPSELADKYRVFVQSTSNNRKLVGPSLFLYEMEHV